MRLQDRIDRLIEIISPKSGLSRARHRTATRMLYEGASTGRRTEGWRTVSTSAAAEIAASLPKLRDRSRDLVRNNPFAARAISVVSHNTVGHGITPQISARTKTLNKRLRELWKLHAESVAIDEAGRHSFYGIQNLAMRAVAESGEILLRRRYRTTADRLPLPFQIQVLEGDYLDTTKNGTLDNGNIILQGIEFDPIGRRVGYWLFKSHPGDSSLPYYSPRLQSKRVPAEDIIHCYRVDRPGQIRGVPWLAPVIIRMRDFDEYEDAQLLRQKMAACFTAFVYDDNMGGSIPSTPSGEESDDLVDRVEPGMVELLPFGKRVEFGNPPTVENYDQYTSVQLHAIASGIGVPYEALTGDLTGVNFTSGRMGWLEFQRNIGSWQGNMFVPQVCQGVWQWFADAAELSGIAGARGATVSWNPPAREMIDPTKEIPAIRDKIRAGLSSLTTEQRRQGVNPEDLQQEIIDDNKRLDDNEIVLDSDARVMSRAGALHPAPTETETEAPAAPAEGEE